MQCTVVHISLNKQTESGNVFVTAIHVFFFCTALSPICHVLKRDAVIVFLVVETPACHDSCEGNCRGEGPKGCVECTSGYAMTDEEGCKGQYVHHQQFSSSQSNESYEVCMVR